MVDFFRAALLAWNDALRRGAEIYLAQRRGRTAANLFRVFASNSGFGLLHERFHPGLHGDMRLARPFVS